jgi:mannose-6-phosphate isomerase-like protein (cupin superfamily)/ribosomal protein S18 acetylase RimI-like enzyme
MRYSIEKANLDDLPFIFHLFDEAILFQQRNNYIGWKNYDKEFIRSDVRSGLLYKMVCGEEIACIFSICYADHLIWREKEQGDAIYLHRIILNQLFKGEKIFQKVLDWAIQFAKELKLRYIRLDTWADNEKLIAYYKGHNFSFIENYITPGTENLPLQHRDLKVALLELAVEPLGDFTPEKVNIEEAFSTISVYWDQKIIGQANGQLIKLAKGTGKINWHKHDDQDELFILYKGHLTIQLRDKNIELFPHEIFIVPKGKEHCPISHGESEFLIIGLNITSNAAGGRPALFQN